MSTPPRVSIIVVSYNTKDMTIACLDSVYEQTRQASFELIVVDNASADGSGAAIAERFPDIKFIQSETNLGFAAGNNLAAKSATGDYLLLLNPDTLVLDHGIDNLVAFADANPDARIWGGRTYFGDGRLNPYSCWRFLSLWGMFCNATALARMFKDSNLFNPDGYGGWPRDSVREVEIVTGCFIMLRRDFWEELGGFDLDFFMYAEEADLCYRARAYGARPMTTPDASIIHYGGASEKALGPKVARLFRGHMTFVAKHWSPLRAWAARMLYRLHVGLRVLAYRTLTLFSSRPSRKEALEAWSFVWNTRGEWLPGWGARRQPSADARPGT